MPSDTIIIVPQYVVQRDDRYFSSDEFIPERWLDEKDSLIKHEEAFFPFQLGTYPLQITEQTLIVYVAMAVLESSWP